MTPREQELLAIITAFIAAHGYGPSREELRIATGNADGVVKRRLAALRRHGRIVVEGHRAIRVVGVRWEPALLPP